MSADSPTAADADALAEAVRVADLPLRRRAGWPFRIALTLALLLTSTLVATLWQLWSVGLGVWGTNVPFVWGFDLINYVWWIGIGNGASLFAAVLVLRRHNLRTSVNRFAEGAAFFAVLSAAIFPIWHLGRPALFYWVFPYPATHGVWPQFRSTLTWDLWAIFTHTVVTSLLWYVGLIPDLATLRDRARSVPWKRVLGIAALGWLGSARHWAYHQAAYRLVAIIVLPLLLVMQSTVAFEFATTLVPGWHETRLPLQFVVTGLASGLGAVLLIAHLLRAMLGVRDVIDAADVALLAKLVLGAALATAFVTAADLLVLIFGDRFAVDAATTRIAGGYGAVYWAALVGMVLGPQLLWVSRLRVAPWSGIVVALGVLAGVWLERFSLLIGGLQTDYLPATWRSYAPSLAEYALFAGSLGAFSVLLLLFIRFLPVVALFELRHPEREETGL